MGLLQIAQNIANFLTGQFGTLLVIIAVAVGGMRAAFHGHWGHMWSAIGGGAVVIAAAWIVSTFLGAGGGIGG